MFSIRWQMMEVIEITTYILMPDDSGGRREQNRETITLKSSHWHPMTTMHHKHSKTRTSKATDIQDLQDMQQKLLLPRRIHQKSSFHNNSILLVSPTLSMSSVSPVTVISLLFPLVGVDAPATKPIHSAYFYLSWIPNHCFGCISANVSFFFFSSPPPLFTAYFNLLSFVLPQTWLSRMPLPVKHIVRSSFFWCVSLLFVSDLADAGRDKMGGVSLRISTLSSVNYLGATAPL